MARSTKIYLVYIEGDSFPQAAFTVKHEALRYIDRTFSDKTAIRLYSGADGHGTLWSLMEIPRSSK